MSSGNRLEFPGEVTSQEEYIHRKSRRPSRLNAKSSRLSESTGTPSGDLGNTCAGVLAEQIAAMVQVWEDSRGAREIRANHRSITGWITGQQKQGSIPFESTLERDFAYLALFEPSVERVHSQPMTLCYTDEDGAMRHYTPDFLVEYSIPKVCSRKAVVEV